MCDKRFSHIFIYCGGLPQYHHWPQVYQRPLKYSLRPILWHIVNAVIVVWPLLTNVGLLVLLFLACNHTWCNVIWCHQGFESRLLWQRTRATKDPKCQLCLSPTMAHAFRATYIRSALAERESNLATRSTVELSYNVFWRIHWLPNF